MFDIYLLNCLIVRVCKEIYNFHSTVAVISRSYLEPHKHWIKLLIEKGVLNFDIRIMNDIAHIRKNEGKSRIFPTFLIRFP